MYKDQTAKIIYAGYRSRQVNIQTGAPGVSPLLFYIIEMFALALRASTEVHGVLIDSVQHKLVLYADDFFFLQHPVESLRTLNKLIEVFASASGCKINEHKSILVALGLTAEERRCISQCSQMKWKDEGMCYLR